MFYDYLFVDMELKDLCFSTKNARTNSRLWILRHRYLNRKIHAKSIGFLSTSCQQILVETKLKKSVKIYTDQKSKY